MFQNIVGDYDIELTEIGNLVVIKDVHFVQSGTDQVLLEIEFGQLEE